MVEWKKFEGSKSEYDFHVLRLGGGIYQSYAWGEFKRKSNQTILRVIGIQDQEIIAAASIFISRFFGVAICWIPGGAVGNFALYDSEFRFSVGALIPCVFQYFRMSIEVPYSESESNLLKKAGWSKSRFRLGSGLTLHYNCTDKDDARLAKASTNWRHNLRRSQRHNLTTELWERPNADEIEFIYKDMELLKNLPVQYNRKSIQTMIDTLGDQLIVYRCIDERGNLLSIRAAAIFGNRAWDMLAAASKNARKVYASYATIWSLLRHCKDNGVEIYDLSGVDPKVNKGVYDFKHGVGSKLIECLGEWESTNLLGLDLIVNLFVKLKVFLKN
ncbi:MAG: peptidoglycan bridge formation glycyltransferase FemA/FemB family protein [Bacteroidetes bacterium]|nr:peptidoglycan bridge formation glycyltransferase FemA/FemB family protein [Bacteroidota bacterium]